MASQDLPMEMVNLILSRLPVKSLVRFKCVHKSWRDLISSPEFIKLHSDNKLHGHVLTQKDSNYILHELILYGRMVTHTSIQLPHQSVQTHGYSNGLVCLSTSSFLGFNVHIWNPSIRRFKTVPQPLLTMDDWVLTFAFVPRTNDYRLLRMPCDEHLDGKAEIYSLHTNSWKVIENVPHIETIGSSFCDVNGQIYFMAIQWINNDLLEEILITFDMADEVFRTIKVLGVANDYGLVWHAFYPVIFGESLFLIHTVKGHVIGEGLDFDEEGQDVDVPLEGEDADEVDYDLPWHILHPIISGRSLFLIHTQHDHIAEDVHIDDGQDVDLDDQNVVVEDQDVAVEGQDIAVEGQDVDVEVHDVDVEGQEVVMDRVDVWERKVNDDGTELWTIKHTINDWFRPVGFLKNGEMVCNHKAGDMTRITSYDPRVSQELKDLSFTGISGDLNLVTYFVDTLMLHDE